MKLYKLRSKKYPFKFYRSGSGRNMWTSVGHIKNSFNFKEYYPEKMSDYVLIEYELPEEGKIINAWY